MSGKDDPFGSGGKTVIVPNPGGAPKRDPFEPLPPLSPQRTQQSNYSSPVFNPTPNQPTPAAAPADPNDWVYERAPARPPTPGQAVPGQLAPGQMPGPIPGLRAVPEAERLLQRLERQRRAPPPRRNARDAGEGA